VQACNDVSLEVYPGEIVCLVGENGAGKSTLSSIASGLTIPDAGKIIVNGEEVVFSRPQQAELFGIRLASQELQLCPDLDVATNVLLGHFPTKGFNIVDYEKMREIAGERLASLGLSDIDLSLKVGQLPVVYRAFVQIARALTPGAKVLITDEPTAPMSDRESERLLALLRTISLQNVGIIFVSHRLDEVLEMGDRCVVMRDGKVVDEMTKTEGSKDRIVASMLGHSTSDRVGIRNTDNAGNQAPIGLKIDNLSNSKDIESVTLDVKYGEIVGVYGIAGSGRDSLGMTIFGASKATNGSVEVASHPLRMGSIGHSVKAGLGYVPAERRAQGLILQRSVKENISLADLKKIARLFFLQKTSEREQVSQWIANLAIKTPTIEALVLSLSGGNQQKVLLARWLLAGCKVLVLDDPTRGVDIGSKFEIYELLQKLAHEEKAAILLITSDIEEVLKIADQILVMRKGQIVFKAVNPSQREVASAAYLESA
jgi:ribose transport system ATP-binding protein